MFYEGSEKRLEITTTLNLLEFDEQFWHEMVKQAGAHVLSKVKNEHLKAFLLSESSLFVWKNRLLLITCGETHLLQASLYFQKRVKRNEIKSLLFQRHQTCQPERQISNFQQDSLQLQKKLKGDSQHWSENYCGDIFLFGNNSQPFATQNILMLHELSGQLFDTFQQGRLATTKTILKLKLASHFNEFIIDQHTFEPKGYSLNAICGKRYFTLHITPEKRNSYISLESNITGRDITQLQKKLINLFKPQRAYLMELAPSPSTLTIKTRSLITKTEK